MTTAKDIAGRGYVRVPRPWVTLDVSPAARALLLHLCGAANDKGESWYSYEQLAGILNRSKSAVSGYVAELRDAGVLRTTQQKLKNGFNYRLLVQLVGWSAITAEWTGLGRAKAAERAAPAPRKAALPRLSRSEAEQTPTSSVQPSERRVEPAEHNPTGLINNQKTNTHPRDAQTAEVVPARAVSEPDMQSWTKADEAAWMRARPVEREMGTTFQARLSDEALQKVIEQAEALRRDAGFLDQDAARSRAEHALRAFMARHRLSPPQEGLEAAAAALAEHARTETAIEKAIAIMDEGWSDHWRRLSSPIQIQAQLKSSLAVDPDALGNNRDLARFTHRAWLAKTELSDRRRVKVRMRANAPNPDDRSPQTGEISLFDAYLPRPVASSGHVSAQ